MARLRREHKHTVRLADGEKEVALKVMKELDCKTIPEMFRLLLDYTQMNEYLDERDEANRVRPPLIILGRRNEEISKLRGAIDKIRAVFKKNGRLCN